MRSRGDAEEAERLAREAVAITEPTQELNDRADSLVHLGAVLELIGKPEDARLALARALELYERKGNIVMAERTRTWLTGGKRLRLSGRTGERLGRTRSRCSTRQRKDWAEFAADRAGRARCSLSEPAASVRRIGVTASITVWLENLSLAWLAVTVVAVTFVVSATVYVVVMLLAVGTRREAFKAVSPGMLPPMGLLFGLIVGFLAAQVWSDAGNAQGAVNREASALRSVVILARATPGEPETRMDALVRHYIRDAVDKEWPAMAHQRATLTVIPAPLAQGLQLAIGLSPRTEGEQAAQRELIDSFQAALDARRQRIILSESSVNWVKWTGVILVALLTLIAIAFVHCDNRLTAALAMGLFAAAAAASMVLIAAQQSPFSGQFAVRPDVLIQVTPRP